MVTGLTYSIIPVYIYIEYNGGGTKESPARQAARDGSKWVVVSQAVNGIMRVPDEPGGESTPSMPAG